MHSVTSNAVAKLGQSITLLATVSSIDVDTPIDNINKYKFIVVEASNTETPCCKCVRTYSSKFIQDFLLNTYLHDTARFNETYYMDIRYEFTSNTNFKIMWFAGSWTLLDCKVYGIK